MKLIGAFLKVIRLPNLFFIALAQLLVQFCIYQPLYPAGVPLHDHRHCLFLVLASVCIAAGGYIINDYFDINIDEINKPRRMIVDRVISRRWAIAWHFILSTLGLLFTILAVSVFHQWYLILGNLACIALLWFYSTNFKKSLLIGNVVISLLTAWTILIVFFSKVSLADAFGRSHVAHHKFFRLAVLYAAFAFVSTLVREAIKDMEDMPGDSRHGCRTMPITWGINATKVYIAVWLIVLAASIVIIQVYVLQFQWWWPAIYSLAFLLLPLAIIFSKLFKANSTADFHALSNWTKMLMLSGILSMLFFYSYL